MPLRKTDAMANAERSTSRLLEEVWLNMDHDHIEPTDQPVDQFLRLNIGGSSYLILTEAVMLNANERAGFLSKFVQLPHSARLKVADAYLEQTREYYFQRSPVVFDAIYQFYATGVVHRPPEVCPASFLAELEFWDIHTAHVGSCCADVIPREKPEEKEEERVDDHTFDKLAFGNLRRKMWTFLESPGSSTASKIFELSSTLFVFISVMGLSLGTIPDFQVIQYLHPHNETQLLPDGQVQLIEKVEQVRPEGILAQK